MAFKIIWSEQALDDLQAIVFFIAEDNSAAAETFGYRLISKVDFLARFPQIGRVVPEESDETIREIILRPYRIIYKVLAEKQCVAIVRIWHARGANRKSKTSRAFEQPMLPRRTLCRESQRRQVHGKNRQRGILRPAHTIYFVPGAGVILKDSRQG